MSRKKELDADPNAVQEKEFVGQLNNLDDDNNAADVGDNQSMSVLIILEKNQTNENKIFSRKSNSIINIGKISRSES